MSEKSGIEMLEYIQENVDLLNKRYEVVEQTMKEILNKMNIIQFTTKNKEKPIITSVTPIQTKLSTSNSTKVMGKIKHENRAVIGVFIIIKDMQGNIIKQTKTNRAGDWMCFLSSGRYQIEYNLGNIINAKAEFKVIPGQTLLRLAQPQEK